MKASDCPSHGTQGIGLVCKHVAVSSNTGQCVGFFWGDETDTARPDAWCSECEKKLIALGGQDCSIWFREAEFKILCAVCWDEAKLVCGGREGTNEPRA